MAANHVDERSFPNPYPDFVNFQNESKRLKLDDTAFKENLAKVKAKLIQTLMDEGLGDSSDVSVYTGSSGIAVLLRKLDWDPERVLAILDKAKVESHRKKRVTFLCGEAGPLAILGSVKKSDAEVKSLLNILPSVTDLRSDLPDEMLYGRSGYLYSLLYVRRHFPDSKLTCSKYKMCFKYSYYTV
jgi:secreted Zn-dependent insulinase-like peptidase